MALNEELFLHWRQKYMIVQGFLELFILSARRSILVSRSNTFECQICSSFLETLCCRSWISNFFGSKSDSVFQNLWVNLCLFFFPDYNMNRIILISISSRKLIFRSCWICYILLLILNFCIVIIYDCGREFG